ncbi:hypothetical protein ACOZ4N_02185 [Halorientalis pallida]|uniref:hypothetical protein n=1 Tax=Halorientalis pallida TaxID=2479928 RepID=UPI003C6EC19D
MPHDTTDASADFAPLVPTMPRSVTRTDGGAAGTDLRGRDRRAGARSDAAATAEADAPLVPDLR